MECEDANLVQQTNPSLLRACLTTEASNRSQKADSDLALVGFLSSTLWMYLAPAIAVERATNSQFAAGAVVQTSAVVVL